MGFAVLKFSHPELLQVDRYGLNRWQELSPVDIVDDFFHRRIQGGEYAEVARIDPTKAHEMRRWNAFDDAQKQRIERLGLQGKLCKAAVVKRPFWLSAVGASALLSISNGGFKADGPDDFANLAKESVEGVAQPLAHLGVLIPLYPFVRMAAKGLGLDLKDLRSNQQEVKEEMSAALKELCHLRELLQEAGIDDLPKLDIGRSSCRCLKQFKVQFKNLLAQWPRLLRDYPTSADTLSQYMNGAIKLGFLLEASVCMKIEKNEAWTAAKGMRGMQRAMELFIIEASSSLMSFVTKGSAASTFQSMATGVGTIGTGCMAAAQFLMMCAGLFKARAGFNTFKSMREQSKADQKALTSITPLEQKDVQEVLARKQKYMKRLGAWKPMSQIAPGTSLAVGQALMLSWSVASLAFLASGVAAPAGLAMMLGLVIPGVALTLVSALPKIGLESVFESALEKRFGENGEEDGFDAIEYAQSLPKDKLTLTQHANKQGRLLDMIEQSNTKDVLATLAPRDAAGNPKVRTSDFDFVYHLLSKANKLEEFSAALIKHKSARSLFGEPERHQITKDLKPLLAWKNLKNPVRLRHTRLFNSKGARTEIKTFYHFDSKRLEQAGAPLKEQALQIAVDTLQNFVVRQLRAELRVSERCLEHMI